MSNTQDRGDQPHQAIVVAPSSEMRHRGEDFELSRAVRYPSADQWRQMTEMAKVVADSGIGPEDVRGNPAKVMAITLKGFELGLGFMQSLDGIHVVKGRPELSADLKSALAQQRVPGCIVEWLADGMEGVATVRVTRAGRRDVVMSVTSEQVDELGLGEQAAGVQKATWQKHRPAMMRAYVLRNALRMQCPEVEYGFDAPEVVLAESQSPAAPVAARPAAEPKKPTAQVANAAATPRRQTPEIVDAEPIEEGDDAPGRETSPPDFTLPFKTGDMANRTLASLTRNEIARLLDNYRERLEAEPTSERNETRRLWVARLTAWDRFRAGGAA